MCLIERRRNIHNLFNQHLDPHERSVTFDGKEYLSEYVQFQNEVMCDAVKQQAVRIVDVILSSFIFCVACFYRIMRAILNQKDDSIFQSRCKQKDLFHVGFFPEN